ncbi:S41 family peptidase [bacterium]|nr:S41 family peptidase [bacterium]
MNRRILYAGIILFLIAITVVIFASAKTNIYKQIKMADQVITTIYTDYVDPIDYRKLIKGAIDGMTSTLDPHTVFFTPKQYNDLKIDTRGKFGGLGIQIGLRDKWLTVISPIEGTPAYRSGIQAGDKIIKIEGESTKGITTEEAVSKLRGDPGTKVTITISREGEPKSFDVIIVRDIIEIKPIPYYGLVDDDIGYVRLTQFSAESGDEIKNALIDLTQQGAKGIILDLRSNPGGLLSQAVSVASQFLGKDALVVYTKGRTEYQSREYYTENEGEYSTGSLIVLVDGGSASASEIVTGAIQDHDRGVVLGMSSFGKGLVQSVRPMSDGTALKITTAKYYIPSGRCIQKENYLKGRNSSIISDTLNYNPDEQDPWDFKLEPADTDTTEEKPLYYTKGGRKVYGGGGIQPDIKFKPRKLNKLEFDIFRKGLFFGFAVHYVATHKGQLKSPDFEVTDKMVKEFKNFIKEKDFEYKSREELILDELDSIAVEDSISDTTMKMIDNLRSRLIVEEELDFQRSLKFVKREIKRQLIQAIWGEKERYRFDLKNDKTVQRAIEVLRDHTEYESYLTTRNIPAVENK